MNTTPRVSVLTSCYNEQKYLAKAIESILGQTFKDFEFLLIDDGSTDDTLNIIKHYAAIEKRIFVIEKKNTGLVDSLNVGVDVARGKWIARMDADDIAFPTRLEKQVACAERNHSTVLLGSGCVEIDAVGNKVKEHSYPSRHSALVRRLEKSMGFPPHSSCLFDRSAVKEIGGYNPRFTRSQDVDLWLRLGETEQISCLPQPLVKLRKHSNGISHHNRGKTQRIMGAAARTCHFLRLRGFSDPSQADQETWRHFIHWLSERLDKEGNFEKQMYWENLREAWYEDRSINTFMNRIRLTKELALSRHSIFLLSQKLFGSNLAMQLADEWTGKHTTQQAQENLTKATGWESDETRN